VLSRSAIALIVGVAGYVFAIYFAFELLIGYFYNWLISLLLWFAGRHQSSVDRSGKAFKLTDRTEQHAQRRR
jgi:hypothetical protein